MKNFTYSAPESLADALALGREHGPNAAFLAGGTDLIVQLKRGETSLSHVVNLKRIPQLNAIHIDEREYFSIGALTTHNAIATHPAVLNLAPILAQGAASIGTHQIRERGTIGGNICNASPAGDTLPPLLCLDAELMLERADGGKRVVPVIDFFKGPGRTVREPEEALTAVQIPKPKPETAGIYLKLGIRKAMEIAIVGVAVLVRLDGSGENCLDARIALASVAPTPLRCPRAEAVLLGGKADEAAFVQAARAARDHVEPISDVRGSALYRREMVYSLTRKALKQACEQARAALRTLQTGGQGQ